MINFSKINWQIIENDLRAKLQLSSLKANPEFLKRCVLSPSGLRFIHSGVEEDLSQSPHIEAIAFVICTIQTYIRRLQQINSKPTVWLGMDARPTGPSLFLLAEHCFRLNGVDLKLMGHGPIPELMAATHQTGADGFCYFTASHNPAGHNGFKLGLADGAVLNRIEATTLIEQIKLDFSNHLNLNTIKSHLLASSFNADKFSARLIKDKETSKSQYRKLALKTIAKDELWLKEISTSWDVKPLFLMDMNGSSRLKSIDLELLESMNIEVELINAELGHFKHAIIPEGTSLEPLRALMQQRIDQGRFILGGMVPDCDGDRGNLILPIATKATALKAQETFALCVLAELSTAFEDHPERKLACVANGPTSLRVERLLAPYHALVARAEVGEANVLAKADELKAQGYSVPISGEGSNGGNILNGGTVRDPLMTLLSLLKFSQTRNKHGLSALQRCLIKNNLESHSKVTPWELGFQLLPAWHTTDAFEGDALMPVPKIEHEQLKQNYEQNLAQHFEKHPDFWTSKGVTKLDFFSNEGTANISGPGGRPPQSKGGLQIFLINEKGDKLGFLWMRGSGTEPVFRLVVDWFGSHADYLELFRLHRELIQQSVI